MVAGRIAGPSPCPPAAACGATRLGAIAGRAEALLYRRLGRKTAIALAAEARGFEVEWVDQSLQDSAVDALRDAHRGVGLVEQVSLFVIRRRGIDSAFAFDRDLETAGFRLYRA